MTDLSAKLQSVVNWLRTGYPNGVPEHDYVPLFALLRRQLTIEEIGEVAVTLSNAADSDTVIDRIDAGVEISRITEEKPHDDDITRVRTTLEAAGWPFDDAPLASTFPTSANPEEEP
ncbi:MAG: DUF3349 domain-containing protein [Gordonia sp. (in: high G+C Gram-positive bacteria)]|uniref:DUF3349 domain-containing protein n=1 Tax=Gordonia sp. (in: high G+C Gram-positive bacteria) TaxID=84139 RepID=UPI0039E3490A